MYYIVKSMLFANSVNWELKNLKVEKYFAHILPKQHEQAALISDFCYCLLHQIIDNNSQVFFQVLIIST